MPSEELNRVRRACALGAVTALRSGVTGHPGETAPEPGVGRRRPRSPRFGSPVPLPFDHNLSSIYRSNCGVYIMADPNTIAKQFTDFYYQAFDLDRGQLSGLYVRVHGFSWPIPAANAISYDRPPLVHLSFNLIDCSTSYSAQSPCSPGRAHLSKA
jgi:hypothetical protein